MKKQKELTLVGYVEKRELTKKEKILVYGTWAGLAVATASAIPGAISSIQQIAALF